MTIFQESKIIWGYLRKYKRRAYLTAGLAIISAFLSAVIPYLYGRLVDLAVSEYSTLSLLLGMLLLWLILALLSDWTDRLTRNRGRYIAIDAHNDLLLQTAGHILSLPLSFHKHKWVKLFAAFIGELII